MLKYSIRGVFNKWGNTVHRSLWSIQMENWFTFWERHNLCENQEMLKRHGAGPDMERKRIIFILNGHCRPVPKEIQYILTYCIPHLLHNLTYCIQNPSPAYSPAKNNQNKRTYATSLIAYWRICWPNVFNWHDINFHRSMSSTQALYCRIYMTCEICQKIPKRFINWPTQVFTRSTFVRYDVPRSLNNLSYCIWNRSSDDMQ